MRLIKQETSETIYTFELTQREVDTIRVALGQYTPDDDVDMSECGINGRDIDSLYNDILNYSSLAYRVSPNRYVKKGQE